MDPSAEIAGSVLWDGVSVGAAAVVHDCVLADGVAVPAGLRLARQAVVPRSAVPDGARGHAEGGLWLTPLDAPG